MVVPAFHASRALTVTLAQLVAPPAAILPWLDGSVAPVASGISVGVATMANNSSLISGFVSCVREASEAALCSTQEAEWTRKTTQLSSGCAASSCCIGAEAHEWRNLLRE